MLQRPAMAEMSEPSTGKLKLVSNKSIILGEGGFSSVFLGKLNSSTVAIKMVSLKELQKKKLDREEILRKLNHPNIIKLLYQEDDNRYR